MHKTSTMTQIVYNKFFYFLIIPCTVFLQAGCHKTITGIPAPVNLSVADKIAGLYSGTGKYLPGGINLGNTLVCVAPPADYQSKYQSAPATVNITKLTDSSVTITLLTGPFPKDTYTALTVKESGNLIMFGSLGSYDNNTKALSFSGVAPNFSYSYIKACQIGLPYYYSSGVILYPNPDQIAHYTIKRYEFGGTKQ